MPRKELIHEIPTISESQLWPRVRMVGKKSQKPLDIMGKSYIIAITGPRGGIKSGSLAYLCIHAMAKGHRAITNLPVHCHFKRDSGEIVDLQTEPLDIETLILNPMSLEGSLIAWDEYQQHDRSGSHLTTQHQLLIGQWEQIRKQEITFAYVAKRINLIPGDIAWETDLEINCHDISREGKEMEGERCVWEIKDLSGYWTRKMFDPKFPITYRMGFYHRAIMGSYDTRQRFDPLEAKRGFQLDLQKRVISDKDHSGEFISDEEYYVIKEKAKDLLKEPMRRSEFFAFLDIKSLKVRGYIKDRLSKELGVEEVVRAGTNWLRFRGQLARV